MRLQDVKNDLNAIIQERLTENCTSELSGQPFLLWKCFKDKFLNPKEKAVAEARYRLHLESYFHGQKLPTVSLYVRLAANHPAAIVYGDRVLFAQDILYVHRKKVKHSGPNGYSGLLADHVELAAGIQPVFDLDGLCSWFSEQVDVRCKPILDAVETIDQLMKKLSVDEVVALLQASEKVSRYFPINLLYSEALINRNPRVWATSVLNPEFRAELLNLRGDGEK